MKIRFPWQKAPSSAAFSTSALLSVVSASSLWCIRGDADGRLVTQVMDTILNKTLPPAPEPRAKAEPKQDRERPEAEQYREDYESESDEEYVITEGGVAIIPVHGVMVDSEPTWWFRYYGLCSTPQITRWLLKAREDQRVQRVLLHLDTPGGQASGMTGLADAAWSLRQEKETVSFFKDACSAGYFLGSQANRVYVAPDGMSGCIGSLYLLTDWSGMFAQGGIKRIRITSTGAEIHKGQGAMGTEITEAQQADFKRVSDEYQGLFNRAVTRGRGFSPETMTALADGRYHVGQWGVDLNLADQVATESQVLEAMNAGQITLLDQGTNPPSENDANQSRLSALNNNPARSATSPEGGPSLMNLGNISNIFRRTADEFDKEAGQQSASTAPPTAVPAPAAPTASAVPVTPAPAAPNAASGLNDGDQAELTRLRGLEDRVLKNAREAATQSAVRAFKDEQPDLLERVKTSIANCKDLDELQMTQTRYDSMTPTALRPSGTPPERQLGGNEQLATTGDEKEFYDNIRANPAK